MAPENNSRATKWSPNLSHNKIFVSKSFVLLNLLKSSQMKYDTFNDFKAFSV